MCTGLFGTVTRYGQSQSKSDSGASDKPTALFVCARVLWFYYFSWLHFFSSEIFFAYNKTRQIELVVFLFTRVLIFVNKLF